jgi:hypothetical protein
VFATRRGDTVGEEEAGVGQAGDAQSMLAIQALDFMETPRRRGGCGQQLQ